MKTVNESLLEKIRMEKLQYFSIPEICSMFKIGRKWIDDALTNCELDYISPNNRDRYIRLEDYMKWQTERPKDESKKRTQGVGVKYGR